MSEQDPGTGADAWVNRVGIKSFVHREDGRPCLRHPETGRWWYPGTAAAYWAGPLTRCDRPHVLRVRFDRGGALPPGAKPVVNKSSVNITIHEPPPPPDPRRIIAERCHAGRHRFAWANLTAGGTARVCVYCGVVGA